jgi:hypothetical protein
VTDGILLGAVFAMQPNYTTESYHEGSRFTPNLSLMEELGITPHISDATANSKSSLLKDNGLLVLSINSF